MWAPWVQVLCFIPSVYATSRIVAGAEALKNKVSTAYLYTQVCEDNVTIHMPQTSIKSPHPYLHSPFSLYTPFFWGLPLCFSSYWILCLEDTVPSLLSLGHLCNSFFKRFAMTVTFSKIVSLSPPFPLSFLGFSYAKLCPCTHALCFSNDLLEVQEANPKPHLWPFPTSLVCNQKQDLVCPNHRWRNRSPLHPVLVWRQENKPRTLRNYLQSFLSLE